MRSRRLGMRRKTTREGRQRNFPGPRTPDAREAGTPSATSTGTFTPRHANRRGDRTGNHRDGERDGQALRGACRVGGVMTDVSGSDSAGSIETYGRHRNAVESLAAYVRGKPNKFVRLLRAKVTSSK